MPVDVLTAASIPTAEAFGVPVVLSTYTPTFRALDLKVRRLRRGRPTLFLFADTAVLVGTTFGAVKPPVGMTIAGYKARFVAVLQGVPYSLLLYRIALIGGGPTVVGPRTRVTLPQSGELRVEFTGEVPRQPGTSSLFATVTFSLGGAAVVSPSLELLGVF